MKPATAPDNRADRNERTRTMGPRDGGIAKRATATPTPRPDPSVAFGDQASAREWGRDGTRRQSRASAVSPIRKKHAAPPSRTAAPSNGDAGAAPARTATAAATSPPPTQAPAKRAPAQPAPGG